MKCVAHLQGLDWECREPENCENEEISTGGGNAPGDSESSGGVSISVSSVSDSSSSDGNDSDYGDEDEGSFKTYKDDSALKDQQSTGRKRAAKMYPMDEAAVCEWALKKNCGGGKNPIIGCLGNLQQARHHGPDKNTLNNEKGNVHRICHTCHNRWHTLNDEGYVWGDLYEPHSPQEANAIDVGLNEEWWEGRKIVKAKD